MKDLNWENFEDGPFIRTRERIHVTITRNCRIYFNKKAWEALGGPDGVALMYDSREKLIGVRASQPNRRETFRLRKKNNRETGWTINAMNFCRRYKIQSSETLAFTNVQSIDGPIIVLDLNDVHSVSKTAAAK
jgi:hypothetical protein